MTSKVVAPKFKLSIPPRDLMPVTVVSTSPATNHGKQQFPTHNSRSTDDTPVSAFSNSIGGGGSPQQTGSAASSFQSTSLHHQSQQQQQQQMIPAPFHQSSGNHHCNAANQPSTRPHQQPKPHQHSSSSQHNNNGGSDILVSPTLSGGAGGSPVRSPITTTQTNTPTSASGFPAVSSTCSTNAPSQTRQHCPQSALFKQQQHPFTQSSQQAAMAFGRQQQLLQRPQLSPLHQPMTPVTDGEGSERLLWNCRQPRQLFEATEVLPRLFLGSYLDAASAAELEERNIRRIVNVAKECPISDSCRSCEHLLVKKYDIDDHSDEDITSLFNEAVEFIHEGILAGEGVIVHCRQGVSRSATIVLAYLMRFGVADFVPHLESCNVHHLSHQQEQQMTRMIQMHRQSTQTSSAQSPCGAFPDSPLICSAAAATSSPQQQQQSENSPSDAFKSANPMHPAFTFDHPDHIPTHSNETVGSCESDMTRGSVTSVGSSLLSDDEVRNQAPCLAEGLQSGTGCTHCKGSGMCYPAAFDLVKTKRPHISPNLGFVLALYEIDRKRGLAVPVA